MNKQQVVDTKQEEDRRRGYPKDLDDFPSVTEVLSIISNPGLIEWFKRTDYKVLLEKSETAKKIGTLVNEMIDCHETGKKVSVKVPSKMAKQVKSAIERYFEWKKMNSINKVNGSQLVVFSKTHGYKGTLDRIEKSPDGLILIDWKVSKKLYFNYFLQLIAYKNAYEELHEENICKCYLVRLDKESMEFNPDKDVKLVDDSKGELFNCFVDLLNFYKKYKKMEGYYANNRHE